MTKYVPSFYATINNLEFNVSLCWKLANDWTVKVFDLLNSKSINSTTSVVCHIESNLYPQGVLKDIH